MEDILLRLIDIVQETAPALWAIARRQVAANIAEVAIWFVFCAIAAIALAFVTRHGVREYRKNDYNSSWELGAVFSGIGSVGCALVAFGLSTSLVKYLINPEFYAIKVLMDLIT